MFPVFCVQFTIEVWTFRHRVLLFMCHVQNLSHVTFFSSANPYSSNIRWTDPLGTKEKQWLIQFSRPGDWFSVYTNIAHSVSISGPLNKCTCLGACLCKPTPKCWDVGVHLPSRPSLKERLQVTPTSCFQHKQFWTECLPPHAGKTICPIT